MNKSLITNLIALLAMLAGWFAGLPWLWSIGLFAFSGAVTNWLAVHMLFEKVPLLYGSGVIPARFAELKLALQQLVMQQFFSQDNLQRLTEQSTAEQTTMPLQLKPIIETIDLEPAFAALLDTVQKSSLGGMLAMFGGAQVLEPLQQPFIDNLRAALVELAESEAVQQQIRQQLITADNVAQLQHKIAALVQVRLDELTPQLVKQLMQQLIAEHLGWLVIWGGVFGGLIGLLSYLLQWQFAA